MFSKVFDKFKTVFASIPTLLAAIIPVFKSCPPCPMCMPKYAAILSLLGLELADYSHYLMPLMFVSMACTIFFMLRQCLDKKVTKLPLLCAVLSCTGLLMSKYLLDNSIVTYVLMFGLMGSIVWHQFNLRQIKTCCPGH